MSISEAGTDHHRNLPSKVPGMINQLTGLFKEILAEIHREADLARIEIRRDSEQLVREREAIAAERALLEKEKYAFKENLLREQSRLNTLIHTAQQPDLANSFGAGNLTVTTPDGSGDVHHRSLSTGHRVNSRKGSVRRSPAPSLRSVASTTSRARCASVGGASVVSRQTTTTGPTTAEARAMSHARNFDAAPVQKFGLQVEGPLYITCWNGLDKHGDSSRVLLTNIRSMAQLACRAADSCRVKPAPSFLYTPDGVPIHRLAEIAPGADYLVLQHGHSYREEYLPSVLLHKLVNGPSHDVKLASSSSRTMAWNENLA